MFILAAQSLSPGSALLYFCSSSTSWGSLQREQPSLLLTGWLEAALSSWKARLIPPLPSTVLLAFIATITDTASQVTVEVLYASGKPLL